MWFGMADVCLYLFIYLIFKTIIIIVTSSYSAFCNNVSMACAYICQLNSSSIVPWTLVIWHYSFSAPCLAGMLGGAGGVGSIYPRAAVALQRLFQTQYHPHPRRYQHFYPRVKRNNYNLYKHLAQVKDITGDSNLQPDDFKKKHQNLNSML